MNSSIPSTVAGASVSASNLAPSTDFTDCLAERPLIVPLYLSSSGFTFVCLTSYTNFCFMQYLRFSAFFGENGSLRDGLAESFWFYSQNLPTVALLLPRAGLSLALLLAFSKPNPEFVGMAEAGFNPRDRTFFRASDGTLSDYARGVLIANAAWTAWRILVLIVSWCVLLYYPLPPTFNSFPKDRPVVPERPGLRRNMWAPLQMGGRRT